MTNLNGIRDRVERAGAYAVIALFSFLVLWCVVAETYFGDWAPSEIVYMLIGHLYNEFKAVTVGRGEGGTFEGEKHP